MRQNYSISSIFSGQLTVTIEKIGTFIGSFQEMSLAGYAANVYTVLTGKIISGSFYEYFELVSFDPKARKLKVRMKKST